MLTCSLGAGECELLVLPDQDGSCSPAFGTRCEEAVIPLAGSAHDISHLEPASTGFALLLYAPLS